MGVRNERDDPDGVPLTPVDHQWATEARWLGCRIFAGVETTHDHP